MTHIHLIRKILKCTLYLFLLSLIIFKSSICARDLFVVKGIVNPGQANEVSVVTSMSNAEDAIRQLESDKFNRLVANYTDTTPALAVIDFRGLLLQASFPTSGPELILDIPSLNIHKQFNGATRDESVDELVKFFQFEGGRLLNKIQKKLAEVSPVDPIAGNPNSLQSSLINEAFSENAFDNSADVIGTTQEVDKDNVFKIGMAGGRFYSDNIDGNIINIPLAYTIRFDKNPKWQLKFHMPLQLILIEDAEIYSAGLGMSLRMPISDNWAITPTISWGATGSIDAASAAQMWSYSLTSQYRISFSKVTITIGNMIGRTETLGFKFGDYDIDPDIKNTIYKNGIQAEFKTPIKIFGSPCSLKASFANTFFTGDELYLNSYNDLAISFGKQKTEGSNSLTNYLRIGITYTFGSDFSAIKANLGYSF